MKELYNDIRKILLNDWDPINISDNINLHDEYDEYICQILKLIINENASEENLYNYLKEIENEKIGLSISDAGRWTVVKKIFLLISSNDI